MTLYKLFIKGYDLIKKSKLKNDIFTAQLNRHHFLVFIHEDFKIIHQNCWLDIFGHIIIPNYNLHFRHAKI